MLKFENVSREWPGRGGGDPVRALDGADFEIGAGEFVVVRGASGGGKTTLLMTAGAMLRPTSGRVLFNGADVYAGGPRERARLRAANIGFVFQMFHLVPYLNVLENVLLPPAASGGGAHASERRAEELLEELGMAGRSRHRPAELSAGERQRTAIARALLNEPALLLADEPTGNLDPDNTEEVFRHLAAYREKGGTVLVVTHGREADRHATRVIELKSGRIIRDEAAAVAAGGGVSQ